MTRDYAIKAIKEAYGNSKMTDEIIKALEQESINCLHCPHLQRKPQRCYCYYGGLCIYQEIKAESEE